MNDVEPATRRRGAAGANSIGDMALLRHGETGRVSEAEYALSTLESFRRAFTFGHVRQVDAVASRFLTGLAAANPMLAGIDCADSLVLVDLDETECKMSRVGPRARVSRPSGLTGAAALASARPEVTRCERG